MQGNTNTKAKEERETKSRKNYERKLFTTNNLEERFIRQYFWKVIKTFVVNIDPSTADLTCKIRRKRNRKAFKSSVSFRPPQRKSRRAFAVPYICTFILCTYVSGYVIILFYFVSFYYVNKLRCISLSNKFDRKPKERDRFIRNLNLMVERDR